MYENLSRHVCDKYYEIFHHDGMYHKGYMLNYHCGNVVMLTDKGIIHCKYNDIESLIPIRDSRVTEELKEMVADINKAINV